MEVPSDIMAGKGNKNKNNFLEAFRVESMVGTPSPKTMRVVEQLKNKKVVILINTGSTHNFVNTSVAFKCNILITKASAVQVKVANGEALSTAGRCSQF